MNNCSGCPEVISGECITYDGAGISGLTYPEDANIDQVVNAIGIKTVNNTALLSNPSTLKASLIIGASNLNTLPATPVVIIPAVNGKTIVVVNVVFRYTHVSVSFTNSLGALLRYTGSSISIASFGNTFATSANHINITNSSAISLQNPTATQGISVELGTTGTFSGGDGSIQIDILYYLV